MIVVGVHLFYRMIMRRGCILALFCGNEDKRKVLIVTFQNFSKNIVTVESCTKKAGTNFGV